MTDELEETEEEIETDADDLRKMIRDEIESVLRTIPGEGSVTDIKQDIRAAEDDEPISLRAVEASVRRIVEEAMIPLREAQKKPAKKAPARKEPEPAPAPEPAVKSTRERITRILWGSDE